MKRKFIQALCWAIIALLAVGIITDWLVLLGCKQAWQYTYNIFAFLVTPFLLAVALPDKVFEKDE